jgi:ATP-dependent DNA ligase
MAFDLPGLDERDLRSAPLGERRASLEHFLAGSHPNVTLSPFTRDLADAQAWLDASGGAVDGVIAKRLDGPYVAAERAMLKVKRLRSADCVVGGFRYGEGTRLAASLLLGLYDDAGLLHHVGFTSMINKVDAPALTERLEALRGEGFTGKSPGGPSRWSNERTETYEPLRHELVIEVTYDHMSGGRFRHGTRIVRWRPDKAPAQCTWEQVTPPAPAAGPVADALAGVRTGL